MIRCDLCNELLYNKGAKAGDSHVECREIYNRGRADERAKCADLTSDLVRALEAVEWVETDCDGGFFDLCPVCRGMRPAHEDGCSLDAALKKAGAR